MKKFLAFLLTAAMLFTVAMPMAMAEDAVEDTTEDTAIVTNEIAVSGTETTVIKAEDYPTFTHTAEADGAVSEKTVPVVAGTLPDETEGSYLRTGYVAKGVLEQKFLLTTEKTGVYKIEYVIANAGHLSKPRVAINGVSEQIYSVANADNGTTLYFDSNDFKPAQRKRFALAMQAGERGL